MSNFPRREISEVIEIANREPSIQSIFVEGKLDKDFFEKYIEAKGLSHITNIYCIDTIEIPDSILTEKKLNFGSNKSRTIALANEVSEKCGSFATNALCIVDADCDRELGKLHDLPALCYTDFTCLEMYGLDEAILSSLFKFSLGVDQANVLEFRKLMEDILPTLFSLRCCNDELSLNSSIPEISSGFERKKGNKFPSFSSEKFLSVFIQNNKLNLIKQEITEKFTNRLKNLCIDIRDKSHGHDAIKLLFIYLNRIGILHLNSEEIEKIGNRIILGSINLNELDVHKMFSEIFTLSNK